jgi:hypothetical protein
MTDANLIHMLNSVWAGVVKTFEIDLNHSTINLEIDMMYTDKTETHRIKFVNVDMFYFDGLERNAEWQYTELTAIHFHSNTTKDSDLLTHRFPKNMKRKDSVCKPNFSLEFWSTELLIHASSLSFDDVLFQEL